jgi:hypothetical protein
MPLYRFHLDSQAKVVADAVQETPSELAKAGHRDGFIAATITRAEPKGEVAAPTRVAIPFQHIELIELL